MLTTPVLSGIAAGSMPDMGWVVKVVPEPKPVQGVRVSVSTQVNLLLTAQ
jgi:hypothetical protein